MTELSLEVKNLKETQREMERIVADLHGAPMLQAMRDCTLMVQRDARINAPVDTGRLRASLTPEVRTAQNDIQGVVGSNLKYAPYMEFGTRHTRMPPPSALDVWARRHGIPSGFLVARAILRRGGLRARRFLQKAIDSNKDRIVARIEQAVQRAVEG